MLQTVDWLRKEPHALSMAVLQVLELQAITSGFVFGPELASAARVGKRQCSFASRVQPPQEFYWGLR
jgi:hypothetical protein